jgi:sugar transferase (PEP-CTERM/EpsH1 system associated)
MLREARAPEAFTRTRIMQLHLLVLDEEFPFPLTTGKRIRSFNLLRHLAADFRVTYLAFGTHMDAGCRALQRLGVHPVPVAPPDRRKRGLRFYGRLAGNLTSPYPFIVDEHHDPRYASTLRELVVSRRYDAVIVEWTPYARYAAETGGLPRIVVAHNVEWRIWEGYLRHARNPLKRLFLTRQLARLRRFESWAWRTAHGVAVVSPEEAQAVRAEAPDAALAVVPNGVDVPYFSSNGHRRAPADPPTVVFTGSMDWRPNQDAVLHYHTAILPHLLREEPALRSLLVGRHPPPALERLHGRQGITVTGTVPDVRPYLEDADVVIVPLRIGAGSRLKILEAMAMGKPVVSTRSGCEGLGLVSGRDLLVADTPLEFSAAVIRLLRDSALRDRLAQGGRALVRERHDWPRVYTGYRDLILGIARPGSFHGRPDEAPWARAHA